MGDASITIFGPADGFKAYRLPLMTEVSDGGYALADSVIQLKQNGGAFVIHRLPTTTKTLFHRFSVYRQVYEPTLSRLGHVFGASLDCFGELRSSESIVSVLSGLLSLVEEGCVHDSKFCDLLEFKGFLSNKVMAVFDRAVDDLQPAKYIAHEISSPSGMGDGSAGIYSYAISGDLFGADVVRLINWFLYQSGGMLCKALYLYLPEFGAPGAITTPLPALDEMNYVATRLVVSDLLKKSKDFELIKKSKDEESQQWQQRSLELNKQVAHLESQNQVLKGVNLKAREPPAPSLRTDDLNKIRFIVQECLRNKTVQNQKVPSSAQVEKVSKQVMYEDSSDWLTWVLVVIFVFIAVGAVVFFTYR